MNGDAIREGLDLHPEAHPILLKLLRQVHGIELGSIVRLDPVESPFYVDVADRARDGRPLHVFLSAGGGRLRGSGNVGVPPALPSRIVTGARRSKKHQTENTGKRSHDTCLSRGL
jgi:hypothetical protein